MVFIAGAVLLVALRFLLFHFMKHGPDTLVLYVIGFDDPESINNINYFLEHGVRCGRAGGRCRRGEGEPCAWVEVSATARRTAGNKARRKCSVQLLGPCEQEEAGGQAVAGDAAPQAPPQHCRVHPRARRENDNAYYVMVVRPDFQAELVDIPIKIPHHMELVRPPSRCGGGGRRRCWAAAGPLWRRAYYLNCWPQFWLPFLAPLGRYYEKSGLIQRQPARPWW